MKHRLLSLALCLALVLGLGITAYGADTPSDDPMSLVESGEYSGGTQANATQRASSHTDFTHRTLKDGETVRLGIDVSQYQGTIDWPAVADSGVEFVFIRAGYRGYGTGTVCTDSKFKTNIQGALDAGLKVGVYFYTQAITVEEAQEEANYVLDLVKGYQLDLPIVIDFEYPTNNGKFVGRLYEADLSIQENTDICNAFCDTVEAAGYDAAVYANYTTLRGKLLTNTFPSVWLAQYIGKTGYPDSYDFWQCSDGGDIPGISGKVDLDFWYVQSDTDTPAEEPDEEPKEDPKPDYSKVILPFTDAASGAWYYGDIQKAYALGVVKGTSSTALTPNRISTRGEVVTMLYRTMGKPSVTITKDFSDVDTTLYYADAISWATKNGVVKGYGNGVFGVNDTMTRQDLVTMLYRLNGSPAVSGTLSGFGDIGSISSYASDAVLWAVQEGLMQGDDNKLLRPTSSITRAEACTLLMRYLSYIE
jgi:GH25 family lysozyme M1 (1,4-beta-N-acetylmuramidase)